MIYLVAVPMKQMQVPQARLSYSYAVDKHTHLVVILAPGLQVYNIAL